MPEIYIDSSPYNVVVSMLDVFVAAYGIKLPQPLHRMFTPDDLSRVEEEEKILVSYPSDLLLKKIAQILGPYIENASSHTDNG